MIKALNLVYLLISIVIILIYIFLSGGIFELTSFITAVFFGYTFQLFIKFYKGITKNNKNLPMGYSGE